MSERWIYLVLGEITGAILVASLYTSLSYYNIAILVLIGLWISTRESKRSKHDSNI